MILTVVVVVAAVILPYTPVRGYFAFEYLPLWFLPVLLGILVLYIGAAEITKSLFFRRANR
jgi:hypothetical protein